MTTLEYYINQNKNKLRRDVVFAFDDLRKQVHPCRICHQRLKINDYTLWHPEKYLDNAWEAVELMEHFGYTGYDYDTVLYTFFIRTYDVTDTRITGEGTTIEQAICNAMLNLWEWKKNAK